MPQIKWRLRGVRGLLHVHIGKHRHVIDLLLPSREIEKYSESMLNNFRFHDRALFGGEREQDCHDR
jgi:hypothetical protein